MQPSTRVYDWDEFARAIGMSPAYFAYVLRRLRDCGAIDAIKKLAG